MLSHLNLGFIGMGLIGGSIAKSLKKRGADIRVFVYSRRKNPDLEAGCQEGIIDEIVYEIDDSFATCDIVFLCVPVMRIADLLPEVRRVVSKSCIITDVGSVKGGICLAARDAHLTRQFIGGHPMAGSEKTGYANATDILLENAYYLLTPTPENDPSDVELLKEVVSATGATCVILDPDEHDRITALISHIPHLIAVTLVNLARKNDDGEQTLKMFAAGGFRDITRIASSSPQMWEEICLMNADTIGTYLADYEDMIHACRDALEARDGQAVYKAFEQAGIYRDSLPTKTSALVDKAHELFVNIDDRAGAIAAIATILSDEGLNIRNIGIIHNREFADGVLRIELNTGRDAGLAEALLEKNHYEIVHR